MTPKLPKCTPTCSTSEGQCDSHKSTNDLRNATPAKMRLFDLPVDLILNIADFLPKGSQACLALTCHGARDIFKKRIGKLSRRERQGFLLALQREAPTKIICQHQLQLVDHCHGPKADPGNPRVVQELRSAYLSRYSHPNRQPCKLAACVPIPSIQRPIFLLTYEHIQRVILRHRLGPGFGSSLDGLAHSSQLSKKEEWAGDYTCDTSLRFRIADNKLYMHGTYEFRGADLARALTFTRHHFDICPHLYLDHNRRLYHGLHRVAIRLPGKMCHFYDSYCCCLINGSYDPVWTPWPPCDRDRTSYVALPSSCRSCATDVALHFDDVQKPQMLKVDFWRCLGDGGFEDCDAAWLRGALSARNESGDAVRNAPASLPRLVSLESFEQFSGVDNTA